MHFLEGNHGKVWMYDFERFWNQRLKAGDSFSLGGIIFIALACLLDVLLKSGIGIWGYPQRSQRWCLLFPLNTFIGIPGWIVFIFCIQQSDRLSQCNHLGLLPFCVAIDPNIGSFNDRFCVRSLSPHRKISPAIIQHPPAFTRGFLVLPLIPLGPGSTWASARPSTSCWRTRRRGRSAAASWWRRGPSSRPLGRSRCWKRWRPRALDILNGGVPWRGKKVGWKVELVGIGGRIFMELWEFCGGFGGPIELWNLIDWGIWASESIGSNELRHCGWMLGMGQRVGLSCASLCVKFKLTT